VGKFIEKISTNFCNFTEYTIHCNSFRNPLLYFIMKSIQKVQLKK